MAKIRRNETGFIPVESILILVVVTLIGVVGFIVYRSYSKTTGNAVTTNGTTKSATNSQNKATSPSTSSQQYLTIKEWGVKVTLTSSINNATYQIVTNNKYLKPSAFLSTATLDASSDCTTYYTKYASSDDPLPTFQYIERFALTDTTTLDEGQTIVTAQQAAQRQPSSYKQVGNYVYYYSHSNGMPCKEQTASQSYAFEAAFVTITKAQ